MIRFFYTLVVVVTSLTYNLGQIVPNCRDLNASVDEFGIIHFTLGDVTSNVDFGLDSATIYMVNNLDEEVFAGRKVAATDLLSFDACKYIDQGLKVFVSNEKGTCWSILTFKKTYGPYIEGRRFDVYCFDSLVNAPAEGPRRHR